MREQICHRSQIAFVHCGESGCIGLYILEVREVSRKEISRVKKNLEVAGDGKPNTSQLEAVFGHSLIINPSQAKGCIREYLRN